MAFQFDTGRRRETLRAAARAVLPPGVDETLLDLVVGEIVGEAAHAAEDRQRGLASFVDLLDRSWAVRGLAGGPALRLATRAQAESTLRTLATHPLPPLRAGLQALRRAIVFIAYGHSSADGRNPLWAAIGYPGPRDDRPRAAGPSLPVVDARDCPDETDVIVVGSGAGGGVAAAVFAAAGHRVVVLEEGVYTPAERFEQRELDGFRSLFLERGGTSSDDQAIGILAGRAVGGGTVVNWNVSLRLDGEVGEEWDRASELRGLTGGLGADYAVVERRLGLATSADNANNAALREGCSALGWRVDALPRNADGCGSGCGYCTFGCAYGKRHDTTRTFLRDATAAGAQVVSGAAVERAIVEGGRAVGVELRDGSGALRTLRARRLVVFAAGAMRTPKLLRRSGVGSRAIGRSLHLHPTTPTFGVFDHPVEPWLGAPMTSVCKRFAHLSAAHGVVLETAPVHPGLASVAIPWFGATRHAGDMAALSRTACLLTITRDRDPGSVDDADAPNVKYRLSRYDGRHMLEGVAASARILFAAGALEVYTAHTPPVRLTRAEATEAGLRRFRDRVLQAGHAPNRLAVFSAHQMGSARISARATDGAIDERGQAHGVRGLLVADASTFPRASGVNPMLTIMAMAHRIARLHA